MNIKEYIESGILELYVLGVASEEETLEIQKLAIIHPEIKNEIEEISLALQKYSEETAVTPHPSTKSMLMATIDYTERLEAGEPQTFPPVLNTNSKIVEYNEWLSRKDMVAPSDFDEVFVKIIGFTPEVTSAIVWIKNMAPEEVHTNEYEKFLILEGSCDITVGEKIHKLNAGDYFSIPLHINHYLTVTSNMPCKVILQRVAA